MKVDNYRFQRTLGAGRPIQEYEEDSNWANENLPRIAKDYPNLWVAVVGKKVVAAGKVLAEVKRAAQQKTRRRAFPVIFAKNNEKQGPKRERKALTKGTVTGFEYVTLDEVRAGKAKLNPPENLELERFDVKVPKGVDITTIAYERSDY